MTLLTPTEEVPGSATGREGASSQRRGLTRRGGASPICFSLFRGGPLFVCLRVWFAIILFSLRWFSSIRNGSIYLKKQTGGFFQPIKVSDAVASNFDSNGQFTTLK